MSGLFEQLEFKGKFCDFVKLQELHCRKHVSRWFKDVTTRIDEERIDYAYGEYMQSVKRFSALLHSRNPDHYKRAGALLSALNQSEIITEIDFGKSEFGTVDDLESGFTRVSYGDAQHILKFVDFYNSYRNQILSFELAHRFCAAYEDQPVDYDFDYLRNVCRYLKVENNLSVDSLFMLFKSLMMKPRRSLV